MDPDDGLLAGAELAAVLRAHGLEPVPDDPPRRVTPRVLHLRRTGEGSRSRCSPRSTRRRLASRRPCSPTWPGQERATGCCDAWFPRAARRPW